jgi:hypothetical protein
MIIDTSNQDTDIAYGYTPLDLSTLDNDTNARYVLNYLSTKYNPVTVNKNVTRV